MKLKLPERRRFVRIETPLKLVVETDSGTFDVVTTNVSPVGLRFEIPVELKGTSHIDMVLYIPTSETPVKLSCKLVWQVKKSLEDKAPYDVGVEIMQIGDENKNEFLKYLCDLLYKSTYKARM